MQLILVESDYVVAVYDTMVTIYNATTGDLLQDLAKIDKGNQPQKFRFRYASVNIENKQITIAAHNLKKSDKETQSEIYLLREKSVET
jgi:hypothetical protein